MVHIDGNARQGHQLDGAGDDDGLRVGAVVEASPDGDGTLIGMEAPDLRVASTLMLGESVFHVVVAG